MVQEIITFLIVGVAVALAISKTFKKLMKPKKKVKKADFQKDMVMMQHNCSDCSAECMLRNTVKPMTETINKDLCKKIVIR